MAWRGRRPSLRSCQHGHIAYQQALPLPGRANWHASTAPSSASASSLESSVACQARNLCAQIGNYCDWVWERGLEQGLRDWDCVCGAGADLLRRQCALLAKIQKQSTNCACSRTNVSDRYVFIHSTRVLCMQQVAECVLYCTFLISIRQTRNETKRDETLSV